MTIPLSVRLDDDVRQELEKAAAERSIGLATLLREIAAAEAKRIRAARIRAQSGAVAAHWTSLSAPEPFFENVGPDDVVDFYPVAEIIAKTRT
jgi:hypothetical protein